MKTNLRFWFVVFIGFVFFVSGYVGFLFLVPDKTSAIPVFKVCLVLMVAGAVILLGALVYRCVKFLAVRLRPKQVPASPEFKGQ